MNLFAALYIQSNAIVLLPYIYILISEEEKSKMTEKTISSKYAFKGKRINVRVDNVLLSDGHESTREIVKRSDIVCIAALTKDKELLFVKQYRHGISKIIIELPAGSIEKNDTALEGAKRELLEETGAIGENYSFIGECYPNAYCMTNKVQLYYCDVKEILKAQTNEEELLNLIKIPFDKAYSMVLNNKIADARSQIAILRLKELISNEKSNIQKSNDRNTEYKNYYI